MSDEHWSAVYDSARALRVNALRPFGFTERQTRFLVTVMAHSGSFLERQYCAFAGIARGHNSREFVARLVTRGCATAITHGSIRRGRIYHVHHKPLYEAIGLPDDRHRKPQTIGRMVQRLMILDAVLSDRNCWWVSSERDKRSYFAVTRNTGLSAPEYPQLAFGSGPQKTIRYFPDKFPIGVDKRDLSHHVFVYLVTRPIPVDFRQFLLRHAELFRRLHTWTVRVLVPRRFWKAAALYKAALRDELWTPMEPHITDRLGAYFSEVQNAGGHLSNPSDEYLIKALRRYGMARFASLYRAWRHVGDPILWAAHSTILRDARERGWGTCDIQPLTGQYLQLTGSINHSDGAKRGPSEIAARLAPQHRAPLSTRSPLPGDAMIVNTAQSVGTAARCDSGSASGRRSVPAAVQPRVQRPVSQRWRERPRCHALRVAPGPWRRGRSRHRRPCRVSLSMQPVCAGRTRRPRAGVRGPVPPDIHTRLITAHVGQNYCQLRRRQRAARTHRSSASPSRISVSRRARRRQCSSLRFDPAQGRACGH